MDPMKKIKDGNQTLMGEVEMTIRRLDTENKNLLAEKAKLAEKHAKVVQENTMLTKEVEALQTKLDSAEKCPDCKRGSRNRVCQECLNKKFQDYDKRMTESFKRVRQDLGMDDGNN